MKYFSFEDLSKQQEALIANAQKLNKLAVGNLEKIASVQMNALRTCSELGLDQLKSLVEVKDPKALQNYVQTQTDAVKKLAETLLADAKTVAELGVEYNQEAQKIAQDSLKVVTKKAA